MARRPARARYQLVRSHNVEATPRRGYPPGLRRPRLQQRIHFPAQQGRDGPPRGSRSSPAATAVGRSICTPPPSACTSSARAFSMVQITWLAAPAGKLGRVTSWSSRAAAAVSSARWLAESGFALFVMEGILNASPTIGLPSQAQAPHGLRVVPSSSGSRPWAGLLRGTISAGQFEKDPMDPRPGVPPGRILSHRPNPGPPRQTLEPILRRVAPEPPLPPEGPLFVFLGRPIADPGTRTRVAEQGHMQA
jgi:hypothetical protein